jgi:hypothetical protein
MTLQSHLSQRQLDRLLPLLREARGALVEAQGGLRRGCVTYKAAEAIINDIDDLALLTCGDRTLFHLKTTERLSPLPGPRAAEGVSRRTQPDASPSVNW